MEPAKFMQSDAPFNLCAAITSVQALSECALFGLFIAMNGRLIHCHDAVRNTEYGFFVSSDQNMFPLQGFPWIF